MRERLTARVLLLDPDDRLLLMKGRLPTERQGPGAWFTVGGGAEPGETVLEAAAREVLEETGFDGVELGPVVWLREAVHTLIDGEPALFKEHYILARCAGGEPCRDGWADYEVSLIDDIRWWTMAELAECPDAVFPVDLRRLLAEVLAGQLPDEPLTIL
ncbi:MAG TPA: NUDIX domain-containing protein [Phenylobacterium sp.]